MRFDVGLNKGRRLMMNDEFEDAKIFDFPDELKYKLDMKTLSEFNQLPKKQAAEELTKCCGSNTWIDLLMAHFPFPNEEILFEKSRTIWYEQCSENDFFEAFSHHPKIGDTESLRKKFASTKDWAGNEQSGVQTATEETIRELARLNEVYFQKFGYIFIVCATGKSASEMLQLLQTRVNHSKDEELKIAMGEQFKITLIRLKKLIDLKEKFWNSVSQITTHVLDTSIGIPGKGICIKLQQVIDNSQRDKQLNTISLGITNEDGRITDLLPSGRNLKPGNYIMSFDTKSYFQSHNIKGFYPKVDIHFTTFDETHYHVPLLINPFGYSTYRGS